MASIFIVGAGWVGAPLSKHLEKHGNRVVVTKTTQAGAEAIGNERIPCEVFSFDSSKPEQTIGRLYSLLLENNTEIVIGSFPPGFRKGAGQEYADYWQQLTNACQKANIKKLIMVSSTTVYPTKPGVLNELDASLPLSTSDNEHASLFSDNARIMLQAEQSVIDSGIDYTILRFSGLIGPSRHPSRFTSKLKQVSTQAPANMLHLDDAIGAVDFAINQLHNEVVNVTTPNTVSKAEFYAAALKSANSSEPLPAVVDTPDKLISSKKILDLGYSFKFESTLDALHD
ncbi:NAD(P)H-binding protein [Vibrio crassostreae]|uniref:NAD(P)H-binding protein n=1 Tax=Vibrio crassostreae TaxID=246167 RepID=UPI00062F4F94|nr:NAD(P)H-binding protein [Vibrio crassostreae]TCN97653.1 nucleoside-diphosphate-sugar epimerase [Vibrio crassostreae]CAK1772312.1 Nucleoside-diphosphate-sugar epimerase [Vibrio crassostreae]CAK1777121.1 Nucleoside-diphosphate-sugar epimerase [Vibrio crassostreae]CAK1778804.1 Nucleoside-diphosphate-sugar epimerase [Vibrio crassostreae]CAK2094597.1 Nucleoside-diphosphate-sugar epimerase [Vibrio crassostreae]